MFFFVRLLVRVATTVEFAVLVTCAFNKCWQICSSHPWCFQLVPFDVFFSRSLRYVLSSLHTKYVFNSIEWHKHHREKRLWMNIVAFLFSLFFCRSLLWLITPHIQRFWNDNSHMQNMVLTYVTIVPRNGNNSRVF